MWVLLSKLMCGDVCQSDGQLGELFVFCDYREYFDAVRGVEREV